MITARDISALKWAIEQAELWQGGFEPLDPAYDVHALRVAQAKTALSNLRQYRKLLTEGEQIMTLLRD